MEQLIVIRHRVRKLKVKLIWFILMQKSNKKNPSIISKNPDGFIFLNNGKSKKIHINCILKPPLIFVSLPDSKFAGKSIRYGKGVK